MTIIAVQYKSKSTGEYGGREYTYFSEVPLSVGDEVMVPARNSQSVAKVTRIDVAESEVADFADRLKTITEIIPASMPEPAPDPLAE